MPTVCHDAFVWRDHLKEGDSWISIRNWSSSPIQRQRNKWLINVSYDPINVNVVNKSNSSCGRWVSKPLHRDITSPPIKEL